ncbi:MAG: Maf family protein [Planctomycetota bacterium]
MSPGHPETSATLVLASRSPRRRWLLEQAGFGSSAGPSLQVIDPPHDDPATPNPADGQSAEAFAAATAEAKADSLVDLQRFRDAWVLAADTVCVGPGGELIGKPANQEKALAMLEAFVGHEHHVVSGVALLALDHTGRCTHREHWADTATVAWGTINVSDLRAYVATDAWRGKAGGYNLRERVDAGWPITVDGDPATVMGLPMRRLIPELAAAFLALNSPTPPTPAAGRSA